MRNRYQRVYTALCWERVRFQLLHGVILSVGLQLAYTLVVYDLYGFMRSIDGSCG